METTQQTISTFHNARRGEGAFVVLEGVHAIKHALRFNARIREVYAVDAERVCTLMHELAGQEEAAALKQLVREIPKEQIAALAPNALRSGVLALAEHPYIQTGAPSVPQRGVVVFLEDPRDLENIGAVVRVSAGFGAAAVLVSGRVNPWHANCIRASAGLHFAVPVLHIESLEQLPESRQLIACTAEGENMYTATIPHNAVLAFGTERHGISETLQSMAQNTIAIPMQPRVSSLNLATSVSAVLYGALSHAWVSVLPHEYSE